MELIPKAKGTSPVWLHFGFIAGDDGKATDEEKPVCKLCKESVCARGGNTSNLRFHLRKHHPQAFLQLTFTPGKRKSDDLTLDDETETTPRKQQKISESFCKGTIYEKSHPRHKRLTEAVTRYLAGGMIPIYTVDNDHFINMLSQFDSRYKLPGRNYFGDTAIPQFYIEVRNKIVDELKCADYFATTTDLWSSENMVPYLGLTVHFIDRTWTLQARVLETLYFPNDHTADNIGQTLTECFANWGLSADKHVCMTTDNGSNIKKALRDLDWINLSCFGHNLHLAVNGAMNDKRISRTLGVCRTIVSTFSTSWKKRRELKEAQETLGLPKHQLITVSLLSIYCSLHIVGLHVLLLNICSDSLTESL